MLLKGPKYTIALNLSEYLETEIEIEMKMERIKVKVPWKLLPVTWKFYSSIEIHIYSCACIWFTNTPPKHYYADWNFARKAHTHYLLAPSCLS